jgi:hypothetical protein
MNQSLYAHMNNKRKMKKKKVMLPGLKGKRRKPFLGEGTETASDTFLNIIRRHEAWLHLRLSHNILP